MKKILLSAIILAGSATFANAQFSVQPQTTPMVQVVAQDEFKEVDLKTLSGTIQQAVVALAGETFAVKKVEFNAEKELTRVTLTNKEDNSEKIVVLDKEGKEVK